MKVKKVKYILACDPGSKDYGIALLESEGKKIRPIKVGKLDGKYTVNSLENLHDQFMSYRKGLDRFTKGYDISMVIIERFIARGVMKGSLGERISYMIALTVDKYMPSVPVTAVLSASWKNSANRRLPRPLKDLYREVGQRGIETHELDAVLMGIYLWNKSRGQELFDGLSSTSRFSLLVKAIKEAKS